MRYCTLLWALEYAAVVIATRSHPRAPLAAPSVQRACEELQSSFPELTLMPNSTVFGTEITKYWDLRCNLVPACVFRPATPDDVSSAMTIFNKHNAQFAIRGGGHMNYPGANNINDGILLVLNSLNELKVSEDKKSIAVGPGNRWVDVYEALAPDNLYTIGGRLKDIGVPGLTLLGGVSYFLNKYGFTMDNVISYDVVLGNGTMVRATAKCHADLFWALKGSASNYGIVTRFVLKTYEVPLVSSTLQVFDESSIESFIHAACNMVINDDGSVGAGGVFNINYNTTIGRATAQAFGLEESTASPPQRFENFTAIPDAILRQNNVTKPVHWHSQFETPNQMFRITFGHHTIRPDADQLIYIYNTWRAAIPAIEDVEGLLPTFVLNLVPRGAMRPAMENGIGNAFGMDDSEGFIWWQFATSWSREEDDLRVETWVHTLLDSLHDMNLQKGLATEFLYGGDASERQNPLRTYPAQSIERMKSIRDVYDPGLVFTKLNWGGFKLGS